MMMKSLFSSVLGAVLLLVFLAGCASGPQRGDPAMPIAPFVDLERFMGKWYVHGFTPTALDREAYNPTETYALGEDGKILTTYEFNAGGFEGKKKTYRPVATVFDRQSQAEWRMRFFGIINAPYLILYVSEDYRYTVIGHPDRDMAWIMSRSPKIEDARYQSLLRELKNRDFDLSDFKRGEHRPSTR
ncbi:MAG: hypothetical protein SynsKO_12530 [Synoicihabitans sp.]